MGAQHTIGRVCGIQTDDAANGRANGVVSMGREAGAEFAEDGCAGVMLLLGADVLVQVGDEVQPQVGSRRCRLIRDGERGWIEQRRCRQRSIFCLC